MKRTWKNFVTRTAAKILAATLTVTACLSGAAIPVHAAGYGKDGVMRDMTSQQIVEDMGLGYNIGNTFDSIGSFIPKGDPWEYQRGWGNEPVSKHFIQKVKAAGFKTIRLPVSWAQWIDDNNQIDPGYMNAVQTVVDWCMEEDLYVILNIHHDSGAADTSWVRKAAVDWDWTSRRYEAVWTQIANHFKNYGDHLIFEGMNEVEFPSAPDMSRQYEILNSMNQLFVDSVRKTGGNNQTRHLLIPGYNTDIKKTSDRRYHMPNDPAGHCILSIHYYSPSPFCVAEHDVDWAVPVTTWGSQEDIQAVEADLNILAENFLSKGVPVIIGEYGVLTEDNKEKPSIQAYVNRVPEIIMEYGMCPVLWDTSNAGDMKYIERVSGEFYDPVIKNNYLALAQKKAAGQVARRQFDFPNYKRVSVQASPEGWVSLAAHQPEDILGVAFEVECSSGWDSYGGGGIYLDSWDNTIEYQFNSVYDEIVHIFTEEERGRLKDQISVAIWWTDESQGGSHREELSLKDNRVTLLYADDGSAPAGRNSGSSGGSGGGKGSGRPDKSTNPSGDSGTVKGIEDQYKYVLRKDRSQVPDTDEETGIQKLNLKDICQGYRAGDKVRLTFSFLSDGGYSVAATTSYFAEQSASWAPSDGNTVSWECTPSDGLVFIRLWYLGGTYLMFNVKAEVVEKAPRFDAFEVTKEKPVTYSLTELRKQAGIDGGSRIKVTVTAEGDSTFSGEALATDGKGNKVTGIMSGGGTILVGNFDSDQIEFSVTNAGKDGEQEVYNPYRIANIKVEKAEGEALGEFQGTGRIEFASGAIERKTEETAAEEGLKVYSEYDGEVKDISSNLVVNGDWSYGNSSYEIRSDGDGKYIWYPCKSVDSVMVACWYVGSPWKITKMVHVERKAEKGGFDISKDQEQTEDGYAYDLKDVYEAFKIEAGKRVKITVQAGQTEDGVFSESEVWFLDKNNVRVSGDIGPEDTAVTLIGVPGDGKLMFSLKEQEQKGRSAGKTAVHINSIEIWELADENILAELQSKGRIDIGSSLAVTKMEEQPGYRIYYEFGGDIHDTNIFSANLVIDGNWGHGNKDWVTGKDGQGTYIWYGTDKDSSVMVACWYSNGTPFKVKNVERALKKEETSFESFEVTNEKPVQYSLAELRKQAGLAAGDRIKVTVTAEGESTFSGEALATDSKGNKVTGIMPGSGTVLTGNFDSDQIEFFVTNAADDGEPEAYNPYRVTDIKVEKAEGEALGEFQGGGRIEFSLDVIEKKTEETAAEEGLKVYSEYDGEVKDISSNLIVNGDWGYGNSQYEIRSDGDGKYIWYPCKSVGSVMVACWYVGSPWKITKLVHVEKNEEKGGFEPFQVPSGEMINYSVEELISEAGIEAGDFVEIKVTSTCEGNNNGLAVSATDSNGNEITGKRFATGWTGDDVYLQGYFSGEELRFESLQGDDGSAGSYTVSGITVRKIDGEYAGAIRGVGEISFSSEVLPATENAKPGLKISYEGDWPKVKSGLQINGENQTVDGKERWSGTQEYILFYNEDSSPVTGLSLASWDKDLSVSITKIEAVEANLKPDVPEQEEFEPVVVSGEEPYSLVKLMEQSGIEEGSCVKVGVVIDKDSVGENVDDICVSATDEAGNTITKSIPSWRRADWNPSWNTELNITGCFEEAELTFSAAEKSGGDSEASYKITDITIEPAEEEYMGVLDGIGNIQFSGTVLEGVSDETPGLVISYEAEGEIEEALKVNWAGKENTNSGEVYWSIAEEGKILCRSNSGERITWLNIAVTSPDASVKIVSVEPANTESGISAMSLDLDSIVYSKAEIKEILSDEELHRMPAEQEDGFCEIPEDIEEDLVGICGDIASKEDVIIVFDTEFAVSVMPVDGKVYYFFQDGESFRNVRFPDGTVKNVEFLYRDKEDLEGRESTSKIEKDDVKAEKDDTGTGKADAKTEKDEAGTGKDEAKAKKDDIKIEKDEAKAEKDDVKAEEDETKAEKDDVKAEEDEAKVEEDEAKAEEDDVKAEEDEAKVEEDEVKVEKDDAETGKADAETEKADIKIDKDDSLKGIIKCEDASGEEESGAEKQEDKSHEQESEDVSVGEDGQKEERGVSDR